MTGPKGDMGDTGNIGPKGPIGQTGMPGLKGDKGERGYPGKDGKYDVRVQLYGKKRRIANIQEVAKYKIKNYRYQQYDHLWNKKTSRYTGYPQRNKERPYY
ncbi:Hypothetical predicted protein [Mytilus galloprovincialis]|uniref:Uncharacterized protein n=1 Tax=Mytilus galloprovincialis TaxID=29158 RepID=A0A8B6FXY5_MYTGA|nr:Hypothetical predicted protein [Mytilus galloprovincialis]